MQQPMKMQRLTGRHGLHAQQSKECHGAAAMQMFDSTAQTPRSWWAVHERTARMMECIGIGVKLSVMGKRSRFRIFGE